MGNRKCIYLVEGQCEEKLIKALKQEPEFILPGKVKVFNVIQNRLPVNQLIQFDPGSIVIMVFDTDKDETEPLRENIELLRKRCRNVETLTIAQVLDFEDEIIRATDVARVTEMTKSETIRDFKNAVVKMKETDFRATLSRHHFDIARLWIAKPPEAFGFIEQNGERIKIH